MDRPSDLAKLWVGLDQLKHRLDSVFIYDLFFVLVDSYLGTTLNHYMCCGFFPLEARDVEVVLGVFEHVTVMDLVLKENLKSNFFFLHGDGVKEEVILDVLTDTQYLTLKLSEFVLRRGFLSQSRSYIIVEGPVCQENHRFLFDAFLDSNKVDNIGWIFDMVSPHLSYQVVD